MINMPYIAVMSGVVILPTICFMGGGDGWWKLVGE